MFALSDSPWDYDYGYDSSPLGLEYDMLGNYSFYGSDTGDFGGLPVSKVFIWNLTQCFQEATWKTHTTFMIPMPLTVSVAVRPCPRPRANASVECNSSF